MATPSCLTISSVLARLETPFVIKSARTKADSPSRLVCAVSASLSSNALCWFQRRNQTLLVARVRKRSGRFAEAIRAGAYEYENHSPLLSGVSNP